jgi:hypothetical protein
MPSTIKPIIDTTAGGRSYNLSAGPSWAWLERQTYNPAFTQTAIGNRTRGKLGGGPTFDQFLADDPKKFTVLQPPLPLTQSILGGDTNAAGGKKVGQLSLDMLDPFGTLAEASGSFSGNETPVVGTGGGIDPGRFLQGKGMDLFGQSDAGIPARLTDYALALPLAILNKMRGVTSAEPSANSGLKYAFQADPGYWDLLGKNRTPPTDEQLHGLAMAVASRSGVIEGVNSYLVEQLTAQMKSDRDTAITALTSGNARLDYVAKWAFATTLANAQAGATPGAAAGDPMAARQMGAEAWRQSLTGGPLTGVGVAGSAATFLSSIPFVGAQLAAGIAPVDALDAQWAALSVDTRRQYLEQASIKTGVIDFAVQLPLLSGLGGALAVMKGSEGIAGALYKGYDTILRSTQIVLSTGVAVAGANWAAEALWPEYSDILGTEIDRARPISKSSLAGVVNELGFWSAPTFGVVPAIRTAFRVESKVAKLVGIGLDRVGVPHPTLSQGTQELAFFRDGYGGSAVRSELTDAGLTGVDTSVKASFLSHLLNQVEATRRAPIEAALRGEATGIESIDALGPLEKEAWANDQLARTMHDGPGVAEGITRVLAYARKDRPLFPSEEGRRAWQAATNTGRVLDDQLAASVMREYGPNFIAGKRIVGVYEKDAMEAWARAKTTELGGDGTKLGRHDEAGWAQIIRTLHQHEFHALNGELAAAIEGQASGEAGKLGLIASDHIFADDARTLIERLKIASVDEQRALIAREIETKREAAAWFTDKYHPQAGHAKRPTNVSTDAYVAFLEDALSGLPSRRVNAAPGSSTALDPINAFQDKIDTQGTWTLAFKPVDAEGNFVSYVKSRSGGVLKSPWVEYPLTGGDNIELGNRGYIASKIDSVFRGFRTRRLVEFQRGLIFRQLSAVIDVLPEQIDAFHDGILKLAHDARLQAQTVGALAKLPDLAFSIKTEKEITALAHQVFGEGDLIGRDGKAIAMDWPDIIVKANRQSYKLNATAGLTSQLKTMGAPGAAAAVASDQIYTAWRFGFSPLFKGGELVESAQLNAMRGVLRRDPTMEALFVKGGFGNDGAVLQSELGFDPMIQAMTDGRSGWSPSQRAAASMSLYARRLPEDLGLARETASTQAVADARPFQPAFRPAEGLDMQRLINEWEWSPARAQSLVDNAEMVPLELISPLREIDRRARPEPSLHGSLDALGADLGAEGQKVPVIVWWDPATNHAVLADGNHRLAVAQEQGWTEIAAVVEARSTAEVGQAEHLVTATNVQEGIVVPKDGILKPSAFFTEAKQPLDLPPLADTPDGLLRQLHMTQARQPSEEGALLSQLDQIIGENGVHPGLELRAKEILDRLDTLEREKGDGGPIMAFADQSPARQAELRSRMFDSGDLRPPGADPLGPAVPFEPTPAELETAYAQWQRRPNNTNDLSEVAGTPEALFDNILPAFIAAEKKKGGVGPAAKKAFDTFNHPTNYKQGQALALQIDLFRDSFPALLRASGNDGLVQVFHDLHIPEKNWAPWLLEDRGLLDGWLNTKAPEDLAKLLDHAGSDADRAAFNELYASPEWEVLTSLWAINLQSARDEAFGVHFFSPYRSALERSINHPVLGIYPASWTIKAAREWSKFMFDNRTFGELRLGMAPAQAIAEISHNQQSTWAQTHDDTLLHYLEKGPLGSTIFIFNLLMPGDWSSLPFPLSRSIREVLRGDVSPGKILAANLDFLGATRDAQLVGESVGELQSLIFGTPHPDPKRLLTGLSAKGVDGQYGFGDH